MSVQCQLWMGSLEPYMTENFILNAFRKMGEDPISVKLMRNKYSGEAAGYCFVSFKADEAAMDAMHKLNGKPIPGTNPVVRFRLNNASNSVRAGGDREFSVWVGDLTSDVDDYNLYRVFSAKYTSIKTAKVILDNSGFSKGYGFVKFGIEDEQQDALYKMNGYIGLGSKPLRICNAVPKPKDGVTPTTAISTTTAASILANYAEYNPATGYTAYDPSSQYWQNYNWQNYYDQQAQQQTPQVDYSAYQQQTPAYDAGMTMQQQQMNDDLALVEHKTTVDVDKLNNETNERDCNLWDQLERSKWLPLEQLELAASS
ncbi:tRNA selenocysteine 1-associated protein 1 [Culicoides brevitarsis]|uniref:tRNA selenocysteine 1-associated protein 1 n=1 Tax=Culicoides brevitarsis TaxID=469753 RepID=UPI00307B56E2